MIARTDAARSPARGSEFAAGWPAVVAAAVGCGAGLTGLPFYSLSSFVGPFEAEFGWSRGAVTGALLALTVGMFVAGIVGGRLVARFGARRVVLVSIPLFAAALCLPTLVGGGVWTLWLAYLLIALLGLGTSPIGYTRVLAARFERGLGLALGLALAGTGVAAIVLPPLLGAVIGAYGWRAGYFALALIALAAWPLAFAALHAPSAGAAATHPARASVAGEPARGLRSDRARFAVIAAAFLAVSLGLAGAVVHLIPMMRDAGLDAGAAAMIASAVGYGVVAARVAIGWIVDRVHAPLVGAAVFAVAAGGCLLLAYGGAGLAPLGAVLVGFALGAEVDLIAYLVSRYFPRDAYARVYGWQFGMFAIGAGLSPVLLSALRGPDGSYAAALTAAAAVTAGGGALLLALGRYPRDRDGAPA